MRMTFEKDGKIRAFNIEAGRVMVTVEIAGLWVSNPSLEAFLADGWQEYIAPIPEPYVPTLEELVEQKLRERYGINQEFEVQRKRDTEPEAFAEYYQYVEDTISWAKQQPHREENGNGNESA